MWNQLAYQAPAGCLDPPDSLEEDELQLQIVYDAPGEPAEEDVVEDAKPARGAVPLGAAAQSAVKKGRATALPSPPSSPLEAGGPTQLPFGGSPTHSGSGRPAAGAQPDVLAQEVHSLLHRTLQGVTQHSPPREPSAAAGWPAAAAGAAAAPRPQSNNPWQQQQQQQQQPPRQSQQWGGGAEEGPPARRARRPPMHNSPTVPAPAPAAPLGSVGGQQGPGSGGRRWRPAAKPAAQQQAPGGWLSQHAQRQAGGWSGLAAGPAPPATSVPPLGSQAAAAPAASTAPALVHGEGDIGGGFFALDDDLLAAHLHMPPPIAAPAAGARQGSRRSRAGQHPPLSQAVAAEVEGEPDGGGAAAAAAPPLGLGGLLGRPGQGGTGANTSQAGAAPGGVRNPLAALLDQGGGPRGKAAAKKKVNPFYGAGGSSSQAAPRPPLTSPRQQVRPRFAIREAPATASRAAPTSALRPSQQDHQPQPAAEGVQQGLQMLTGRAPAPRAVHGPSVPDAIGCPEDGWVEAGQEQQQQRRQQQPPNQAATHQQPQGVSALAGGAQATPSRGFAGQQHLPQEPPYYAPADPPHPAPAPAYGPPPTSYKTPGHTLRALFHGGTPGSADVGGATGPTSRGPASGAPATGPWPGDGNSRKGGEAGGSAGRGGGMSLQRQFVAALAPVARAGPAPRQRGANAGSGLYGRLQAIAAAEKAQQAAAVAAHGHGGWAAGGAQQSQQAQQAQQARLTVVHRENEANLTKCLCRVELEGGAAPAGAAAVGAGAGVDLAAELALAGTVVALFQSRTAREVDLIPGSVVLLPPPWRVVRPGGGGGGPLVLLCHTAVQG